MQCFLSNLHFLLLYSCSSQAFYLLAFSGSSADCKMFGLGCVFIISAKGSTVSMGYERR